MPGKAIAMRVGVAKVAVPVIDMEAELQAAREFGAKSVLVMVTHPVFCGRAFERLNGLPVQELAVCDTIALKKRPDNINLVVLSVAPLLAEAIRRTHLNESISKLFV
jgi:ribose-phosphate pyrophosphokinase